MIINRGRILLVDDEPLVLEIIEGALKKEGYDVVCAPNSQTALNRLDKEYFDAMVCDVRLENLDGFELLALSRKKNPLMGAVLMTGAPTQEDSLRAHRVGAHYLSKPIGLGALRATIDEIIENARFTPEHEVADEMSVNKMN